jgi:phytoene dehydrogenase-like protein
MKDNMTIGIIGAGIGGMSAGCYLQMNGYNTEIYEMNAKSGGLCTSWKRNGFTFDPGTHWLVGTRSSDPFYHIWQELGVLRDTVVHDHDRFKSIESINGKLLSICVSIDQLEQEMLAIAPEEERLIKEY